MIEASKKRRKNGGGRMRKFKLFAFFHFKGENAYLQVKRAAEACAEAIPGGAVKLEGDEFQKVKEAIEKEQESAAVGLGSIFG